MTRQASRQLNRQVETCRQQVGNHAYRQAGEEVGTGSGRAGSTTKREEEGLALEILFFGGWLLLLLMVVVVMGMVLRAFSLGRLVAFG